MNGFEPLRRRIIDYTEAGQWSEVYDGPLEDCESEKLKAENAKLVMKLNAEHLVRQNMERENAKLREQIHWLKKGDILHVLTDQEYIDQCERERLMQVSIDALDKENAKLRELVRTFYHCTTSGECDECPINGGGPVHLMPDTICDTIHDRMRELGVEV